MFASPHEMYLEQTRSYRMEYTKNEAVLDALDQYKMDAIQS